jgi:hypothetical protein
MDLLAVTSHHSGAKKRKTIILDFKVEYPEGKTVRGL